MSEWYLVKFTEFHNRKPCIRAQFIGFDTIDSIIRCLTCNRKLAGSLLSGRGGKTQTVDVDRYLENLRTGRTDMYLGCRNILVERKGPLISALIDHGGVVKDRMMVIERTDSPGRHLLEAAMEKNVIQCSRENIATIREQRCVSRDGYYLIRIDLLPAEQVRMNIISIFGCLTDIRDILAYIKEFRLGVDTGMLKRNRRRLVVGDNYALVKADDEILDRLVDDGLIGICG